MSENAQDEGGKAPKKRHWLRWLVIVVVVIGIPLGVLVWYKGFRYVPQSPEDLGLPPGETVAAHPRENFLYGSIGAPNTGGIPYWIMLVLPRIFPEYLPGPGGYAAFGLPWEEGHEFPAGFSKQHVGFDYVAFNCALCHATQYRTAPDADPVVVAAGGSNTADIQGLQDFLAQAANDPRFNADTILTEIDAAYPLSWIDRLFYRLVVPIARKQLIQLGRDFDWAAERPRWGPGRDAPMNLTKFNFLGMPRDDSVDNTDFPAIWHLSAREQQGRTWEDRGLHPGDQVPPDTMLMNLDGATTSFRSVLIDSALGARAVNSPFFRDRIGQLLAWLRELPPPAYPLPWDSELAARGEAVFEAHCADCHAPERENRMGTVIPIEEIGTDRHRLDTWVLAAAEGANKAVAEMGITRTPMIKTEGYIALQLDGIWLRGPYLHNGSVPTLRDLLRPAAERPTVFCRGYDVLDGADVGFLSDARVDPRCAEPGPPATDPGGGSGGGAADGYGEGAHHYSNEWPRPGVWKYYVAERGNGNGGHEYGTDLPAADKDALLEYLKTL
jgi:RoxA-like, cytochrome c-like